jgi:hypothetical protein
MSDKFQFVGAFGGRRVVEASDKLKFVGHFHRPFDLLPEFASSISPRRFSFHTTQSGKGSRRSKCSASTRFIPIPKRLYMLRFEPAKQTKA